MEFSARSSKELPAYTDIIGNTFQLGDLVGVICYGIIKLGIVIEIQTCGYIKCAVPTLKGGVDFYERHTYEAIIIKAALDHKNPAHHRLLDIRHYYSATQ